MPDWVVWLVVGFIVYRFCIVGSGSCGRVPSSTRRDHAADREVTGGRGTPVAMRRSPAGRVARGAETPIQAAQRRFVEGATTIEEYEAELDRVLRRRASVRGDGAIGAAPRISRL